jgi:hypothetical protein
MGDIAYPCEAVTMHPNEVDGTDFRSSSDGYWRRIIEDGYWAVSAGSIKHRGELDV